MSSDVWLDLESDTEAAVADDESDPEPGRVSPPQQLVTLCNAELGPEAPVPPSTETALQWGARVLKGNFAKRVVKVSEIEGRSYDLTLRRVKAAAEMFLQSQSQCYNDFLALLEQK
eukprot:6489631-Amphidinium_carterae.1